MRKIYLDYGATTPVDRKVLKTMLPYFSQKYGNAMSLHSFGKEAGETLEKARAQAADFFGASPSEIIFTSGATESNNLAIKGVLKAHYVESKNKPHIITASFEHHCVLDACKSAEKEGLAEVTYIKPDKEGLIQTEDVKKAIKKNTILVSIMYVNNEIGTVQPIAEIGKMLKSYKLKITRLPASQRGEPARQESHKLLFHTDATQAVSYFDCDVNKLGVDLLSMSAHKIYGPKGVGALYIRKGTPIMRVQDGGDQEARKRAGTHNVPGIVGLGVAIAMVKNKESKIKNKAILNLRNHLIQRVLKEIPDAKLNGSKIKRSPNNASFSFKNVEGESLIMMLDMAGMAASTGSACTSSTLAPSHVLLSIGLKPEDAHGSVRFTLGKHTTKKEIGYTARKLKEAVKKLRDISGNVLSEYYKN